MEIKEKIIKNFIQKRPSDDQALGLIIRKNMRLNPGLKTIPNKATLLQEYHKLLKENKIKKTLWLEKMLIKRAVRTLSGVSVVTVLTKPYKCPGQCIYCPNELGMPKSYLADEPAAARAKLLKFDPQIQITSRLEALKNNGHPTDKIELIVKGGTWNSYPLLYQYYFITECFIAANNSRVKISLKDGLGKIKNVLNNEQKKNEKVKHRIIGLTLETRPDKINEKTIQEMREMGCTRIEIGVQTIDEDILKITKRGHGLNEIISATKLLKKYGFKVDYHLMPQLPGSTPKKDIMMIREVFDNPLYRPDMVKIYPCTVVENSELYDMLLAKKYRPYSNKKLLEVLKTVKQIVPRYVRISRLIRDIPSQHIKAGNQMTNLRQVVQNEMKKEGTACSCLRCREIGHKPEFKKAKPVLFIDEYESSGGKEYFISFEDAGRNAVFAFCRLRIDDSGVFPAFIRELHTYGQLIKIGKTDKQSSQHKGLGEKLINQAEKICKKEKIKELAVISGIGVRGYYKKFNYHLKQGYMVKTF